MRKSSIVYTKLISVTKTKINMRIPPTNGRHMQSHTQFYMQAYIEWHHGIYQAMPHLQHCVMLESLDEQQLANVRT